MLTTRGHRPRRRLGLRRDQSRRTLGGTPPTIVTLFGDTPRALAVSPTATRVYAAVFHSGNHTTALTEGFVPDGGAAADRPARLQRRTRRPARPEPNSRASLGPEVGLIVQFDGTHWADELGRYWDSAVRFTLPDHDVFAIDANANPPVQVAGPARLRDRRRHHPLQHGREPGERKGLRRRTSSRSTDVRFEGPGIFAAGFKPLGEPATVRGHLAESRITVLDGGRRSRAT